MVTHRTWTDSETKLMIEQYPILGRSGIAKLLPHRPRKSIEMKAFRLGLKQTPDIRGDGFSLEVISNLTVNDKAYVAGFFDGEGTIGIIARKPHQKSKTLNCYHQLHVSCTNTNEEVIKYLHELFGGSIFKAWDTRGKRRACYRWGLTSRKAKEFLQAILPYLIVKKQEATIAIEFQAAFEYSPYILPPQTIEKRNGYAAELTRLKGRIH